MTASPRSEEPRPPTPSHEVRIERRSRFLLPTCSCGWLGTARVTPAAAREEARDHALLYAGSLDETTLRDIEDSLGVDPDDDITPGSRPNGAGSGPAGSGPAE